MNIASQKPLVSVVIPAYNAEGTIIEALESVRLQTCSPNEIIVVDDGSTDNTRKVIYDYVRNVRNVQIVRFDHDDHVRDEIADRLEQAERPNNSNMSNKSGDRTIRTRFPYEVINLTYLYQSNSGPSKARNTGIKASKGQYIAFLDADDLWTHDKLEKQLHVFFQQPSVDIVFTDVKITRMRNGQIEEFTVFQYKKLNRDFFGHEVIVINPLEKLMKLNFMPTPAVMAKKACFDNGRYFNEKRYHVEDWELWLKMSLHFNFAYVSDVCVHVREMGDGLSSNELEMILSVIDIFESFIEENGAAELPLKKTALSNSLREQYKWTGYFLMKNRNKKLARSYFRKSLGHGIDFKTVFYYVNTFLGHV
jgi:glycosyltransferase involved in cell wall biosynthesis